MIFRSGGAGGEGEDEGKKKGREEKGFGHGAMIVRRVESFKIR
jgi:hypothetical protein